jgi:LPXTG-site transpeptidase (sortase) family protein
MAESQGDDGGQPPIDDDASRRAGLNGRLRALLAGRGALPIIGSAGVVVAVIALIVIVAASGGGNDGKTATRSSLPGESGGLATGITTPEATIDLTRPTSVATRDPNAPRPGLSSGDRMIIAKFGVDAPLNYKVVGRDGQMPSPDGADDVAWYDFSAFPGLGGTPGSGGNSVFSGHVDQGFKPCKNGTVPPPCQAVFWDVSSLRVGDEIEIRLAGKSYKYRVTSNQAVSAANGPWDQIVSSTEQETITMITCGGDFNRTTHEYNNRQVVTAVKI